MIKFFEDFNKDDENDNFLSSLDECITDCKKVIDEFSDDSDNMDLINSCEDCINVSALVEELIDTNSKLLKSQCQIHKLSLKSCIEELKKIDSDDDDNKSVSSCIETCKRCLIDCEEMIDVT